MITRKGQLKMKHAYVVRAKFNEQSYAKDFFEKYAIGIGWGKASNYTNLTSKGIRDVLSKEYTLTAIELGNACKSVDCFVNKMKPLDLVLVPDGEEIYFLEVQEDAEDTDGAPFEDIGAITNIRRAKPMCVKSRDDLSKELRIALKAKTTVADISKYVEEVEALAFGKPIRKKTEMKNVNVSFPLRPDCNVKLSLPADMTDDEARRLAEYLKNTYFVKTEGEKK